MDDPFPRLLYPGLWDVLGNTLAGSVNNLERHGRAVNSLAVVAVLNFPAAARGEEVCRVIPMARFNEGHVIPARHLVVQGGAEDDCEGKDGQHGNHQEAATTTTPVWKSPL